MFDFNRLIDVAKDFLGPNLNVAEAPMSELTSALASAGLDVSALQGLSPDQLGSFLAEHGIDVNSFAPEQLTEIANAIGLEGGITELLGREAVEHFANR